MTTIQRQPTLGQVGIAGAFGGIGLGVATLAVREQLFSAMPGLHGNVGPALLLGGFGGLAAAGASQVFGGNIASDAGVVAGAALLGAALGTGMVSGSGARAASGHAAALLGAIALGGVLARNFVD